jgi:hypothetical protein
LKLQIAKRRKIHEQMRVYFILKNYSFMEFVQELKSADREVGCAVTVSSAVKSEGVSDL